MKLIQSGPRNAKVIVVGEAPGDTEMKLGLPFVGGSGDMLNKLFGQTGLNRENCFFTNVCHIQPQGPKKNDFSWFFTAAGLPHLQAGVLQLLIDIQEIRPNLVIALGAVPMYMLTRKGTLKSGHVTGIDKWRGSILESVLVPGVKVIPTYHPAFLLRSWDHGAVAKLDLARCASDAAFPDLRLPQRQLYLNPQGETRRELMASFLDTDWLSVDIENWRDEEGEFSRLACVGFSDRPDRALVIHAYSPEDLDDIRRMVGSPCDKVMQNGQYDYTILTQKCDMEVVGFGEHVYADGKLVHVRGWDTMLAHHSLYTESAGGDDEYSAQKGGTKKTAALKKGLAFLNSIYTREPYYKDDGKLWRETNDLQMFWRYNALDAAVTKEIQTRQQVELRDFNTEAVFQHEMSLLRPLMACTSRGLPIDIKLILDTLAGRPINVSSDGRQGDLGTLLYDQLGLPVQLNKETRQPSVDKDAIIALAAKFPKQPILLTILAIRERRTILQTFLGDIVDSDGKVHTNYDPTGTRTGGRLASRAPIIGKGTNTQNWPDKIRRLVVASRGRVFIQPDYSQAEARVVAYLAREQALIDLLEDPTKDIHRFNASRVYGCDESAVTYEMRYCAKRGTHSANYGVGPEKTMMVINQDAKDTWGKPGTGITVDLSTARQIVEGYFALYPRIKTNYWNDVKTQLKRDYTLTGVFGRKRTFFGRWDGSDEGKFLNAAYSYIPQNAVGELCTMAMVRIEDTVREALVLGNVHDSILVESEDDPNVVERVIDQMRELMHIPLTVHGRTFYIPTEFQVGYNWGKASKDGSNPNGLIDAHKWLEQRRKNFVTV
jgi:uracil-DNA glycosylase family 4